MPDERLGAGAAKRRFGISRPHSFRRSVFPLLFVAGALAQTLEHLAHLLRHDLPHDLGNTRAEGDPALLGVLPRGIGPVVVRRHILGPVARQGADNPVLAGEIVMAVVQVHAVAVARQGDIAAVGVHARRRQDMRAVHGHALRLVDGRGIAVVDAVVVLQVERDVAPVVDAVLRQHDLGMDDAALAGEIVAALKPVVAQTRGRAVGGGRHRAGAGLAANDLDVKMIDRHRDIISTAKRMSERRTSAPSLGKFSGGGPRRPQLSRQPRSIPQDARLSSLHQQLMEAAMRKPRDFDAELKALENKARDLKSRKVLQLGELVISTGADALSSDELAGALIVLAETKDSAKKEAWAKRGAAFFRSKSRRSAPAPDLKTGGDSAQPGGAQPASGSTFAA